MTLDKQGSAFVPDAAQLRQGLGAASPATITLLAQQYLRQGALAHALAVCQAYSEHRDEPALLLCEASALFGLGERASAISRVESLVAQGAEKIAATALLAEMRLHSGQTREAVDLLQWVAERSPDYPGVHPALARLRLPGSHYREVLTQIHAKLKPSTYLEIGVETGATLQLARGAWRAVGIDPEPCSRSGEFPENLRFYQMTSEDFFSRLERTDVFGERHVDLAFIDGLHLFEAALLDFINVERWCTRDSVVLIHDCLAVSRACAQRKRRSTFWVGDTWKLLDCLVEHRPDLSIRTLLTPPSGLVVVRDLNPESQVLANRYDELVATLTSKSYPHEPGVWSARFGLTEATSIGLDSALFG